MRERYYKINLPSHLIVLVQGKRLEKEFRDFLFAKHIHRNGTIYNYTISRLAQLLSWSRTKVRRLVSIWLKQKWCIIRDGNLCFRNLSKIYQDLTDIKPKQRTQLYIKIKSPLYIFKQFNLCLLQTKLSHLRFARSVQNDLKFPEDLKTLKSARKRAKRLRRSPNGVISDELRVSQMAMSRLFKRHFTTVGRRIRLLKGLVNVQKNKTLICEDVGENFHHIFNEYKGIRNTFVVGRKLYKRESNSYTITFPPKSKDQEGYNQKRTVAQQ